MRRAKETGDVRRDISRVIVRVPARSEIGAIERELRALYTRARAAAISSRWESRAT
jgi:hypothetical protein